MEKRSQADLKQEVARLSERRDALKDELKAVDAEIEQQARSMGDQIIAGKDAGKAIESKERLNAKRAALDQAVVQAESRIAQLHADFAANERARARVEFDGMAEEANSHLLNCIRHIVAAGAELEIVETRRKELISLASKASGHQLALPDQVSKSAALTFSASHLLSAGFDYAHCSLSGLNILLKRHFSSLVEQAKTVQEKQPSS